MSKTYFEPAGDHVLVKDHPRTTTLDGIELPDNMRQQEMVYGTVVHVGPKTEETDELDTVAYGPYAGKTIVLDGVEFRLIREGHIELYIRKTE